MVGAIASSTAGLLRAFERLDETAGRVSRIGTGGSDAIEPVAAIASLAEARAGAEANAASLRVARSMQQRLLDILV